MSDQIEHISKKELLAHIRGERQLLEAALAGLSETQLLEPGVEGDWRIKDVLAHITAWEQRMVGWLAAAFAGETPEIPQSDQEVDALNASSHKVDRDAPLAASLAAFNRSYSQALQAVEDTPEEALVTPDYFEWRERPLWVMVAANTWWHYREHRQTIEAWLAKRGG